MGIVSAVKCAIFMIESVTFVWSLPNSDDTNQHIYGAM